jgi:hypothetical protein
LPKDQRQRLMGFHGRSQSRQLHVGHTIMLMEDQAYLDFVQLIADELQAGLTFDAGMFGITPNVASKPSQ